MPSATLSSRLQATWYGEAPPPWSLRVLSTLFALGVRWRGAAYRRGWLRAQHVGRPVIVVGNITVGGSGKTPLVIWLSEQLRTRGLNPGVVLRGYGGSAARSGEPVEVAPDSDAALVGDEALLLRLRTGGPVVVCRDRVRAARRLRHAGVDVIISDDGLQHLRLARDCEIAVVDAARGLGNGHMLPAGPLREPGARLAGVAAIVINADSGAPAASVADSAVVTMRLHGDRLHRLDGCGEPVALSRLAGQRVHAIAGIGHPSRFFALLRAAGVAPIEHPFPDHYRYRAAELEFGDDLPLLMTEKDAVKCRAFGAARRWYLPVTASFSDAHAQALLARVRRCLDAAEPGCAQWPLGG